MLFWLLPIALVLLIFFFANVALNTTTYNCTPEVIYYIVILGHSKHKSANTDDMRRRCEAALRVTSNFPEVPLIFCGTSAEDAYMQEFFKGAEISNPTRHVQAKTTAQSIKRLKKELKATAVLVTSDYHYYRTKKLCLLRNIDCQLITCSSEYSLVTTLSEAIKCFLLLIA